MTNDESSRLFREILANPADEGLTRAFREGLEEEARQRRVTEAAKNEEAERRRQDVADRARANELAEQQVQFAQESRDTARLSLRTSWWALGVAFVAAAASLAAVIATLL